MAISVEMVAAWGGFEAPAEESAELELLELTISAVVGHFTTYYVVDADPDEWTAEQDVAALMQTSRLWKRRDTPQGIAQFGVEGVVTVTSIDKDVENLLTPKWGFA